MAEEVFWSMLQIAHLQNWLGEPKEVVLDSYQRAHRYRPHRVEPLYHMVEIYNQNQQFDLAYATIKYKDFIRQPAQKDLLFNQDWINDYAMLFQFSICSYYVGRYQESLMACDVLLKNPNLPEGWRKQTELNRKYPLAELEKNKPLPKQSRSSWPLKPHRNSHSLKRRSSCFRVY